MKLKQLLLLLVCALGFSFKTMATEAPILLDSANKAYSDSKFEKAIGFYEEIIANGKEAPELYYNLGNAYFKSNKIAHAILNYERALKLKPGDEDYLFNLKLANQRTTDKIESLPELFINEWKDNLVNSTSEKGWSWFTIICFALFFTLLAVYFASNRSVFKQIGFIASAVFLILGIVAFTTAKSSYKRSKNNGDAIIMVSNVTAMGSPSDKGTELFVIHEGTKVSVSQTNGDWSEIKLSNGNSGWVLSKCIEVI